MAIIQMVHDLPSDVTGKTWKEKNLETTHKIPLWSLVEIDYEDATNKGVRLLVCGHTRDCDGTPLYSLTWDRDYYEQFVNNQYATVSTGGYSEDGLKVIRAASNNRFNLTPISRSSQVKQMLCGRFSRISTGRLYGHTPSPGGGYRGKGKVGK